MSFKKRTSAVRCGCMQSGMSPSAAVSVSVSVLKAAVLITTSNAAALTTLYAMCTCVAAVLIHSCPDMSRMLRDPRFTVSKLPKNKSLRAPSVLQVGMPGVSVILPVQGHREHSQLNLQSQLGMQYAGPVEYLFVTQSASGTKDNANLQNEMLVVEHVNISTAFASAGEN